jgi:hypothetical protein
MLSKIVGEANSHAAKLSNLSNAYSIAALMDKQLVTFADERKK